MKKYITFKADEFQEFLERMKERGSAAMPQEIDDAVVIRRQDVFSPPAFDAYANIILAALEIINGDKEGVINPFADKLRETAQYFHEQAVIAWNTNRKVPD